MAQCGLGRLIGRERSWDGVGKACVDSSIFKYVSH